MERWMAVFDNMRFEEVSFNKLNDGNIEITFLKRREIHTGKIVKENSFTKVLKIETDDGLEFAVVDFHEMDSFFENNNILFQNRKGLHKEIKRYIEFSLS
ncbi:hypothetical protein FHQ18_07425 [Deferribacter autotrophicus]|uniref:Uncharacterized protein n=1 Tax=Deferribacter autotrophicus TaxID=500465 RepID=A0A5A8F648_9BACT|nr:hypothetical protein [Deferribacter autotrophicus]KAA0258214.1 hypothetical protein FHQ18_07425 [Deferribacter autotrophicus]